MQSLKIDRLRFNRKPETSTHTHTRAQSTKCTPVLGRLFQVKRFSAVELVWVCVGKFRQQALAKTVQTTVLGHRHALECDCVGVIKSTDIRHATRARCQGKRFLRERVRYDGGWSVRFGHRKPCRIVLRYSFEVWSMEAVNLLLGETGSFSVMFFFPGSLISFLFRGALVLLYSVECCHVLMV